MFFHEKPKVSHMNKTEIDYTKAMIASTIFKFLPINLNDEEKEEIAKTNLTQQFDVEEITYDVVSTIREEDSDIALTLSIPSDFNNILLQTILKDTFAALLHCIIKKDTIIFVLMNLVARGNVSVLFYPLSKIPSINLTLNTSIIDATTDFAVYIGLDKSKFKNNISDTKSSKSCGSNFKYRLCVTNRDMSPFYKTTHLNISHNSIFSSNMKAQDTSCVSDEDIARIIALDEEYIEFMNDVNHEEIMFDADIKQLINNIKIRQFKTFTYTRQGPMTTCFISDDKGDKTDIKEIKRQSTFTQLDGKDDINVVVDISCMNSPSMYDGIKILISPDQKKIYWAFTKQDVVVRYYYILDNLMSGDSIYIPPINEEELKGVSLDW